MHTDLFPETLLVEIIDGNAVTTSLKVAEHFHKRPKNVFRDVQKLVAEIEIAEAGRLKSEPSCLGNDDEGRTKSGPSSVSNGVLFELCSYRNSQNKVQPMYRMNRTGFCLLAMRFTGTKALRWQLDFIHGFDNLEARLRAVTARYAAALDQVRPMLRPVVEGTQRGLRRSAIAAPLGKSPGSITYHRGAARRLGLLAANGG